MRRQRVLAIVATVVSLVLLGLTLRGFEWSIIGPALKNANWWYLLACVPIQGLGFWIAAVRCKVLLRPLGDYSVRETLSAFMAYFVANNILPFRLGEFVRGELLARGEQASFAATMTIIGVERVLDILFLAALFFGVAAVSGGVISVGVTVPIATAVLVAVTLTAVWAVRNESACLARLEKMSAPLGPKVQAVSVRLATQILHGLRSLASRRILLRSGILTLLYWGTSVVNVLLWFRAFDLQLPMIAAPTTLLFVSFGHFIPSAPSGVGTYHFFCASALKIFGVSASTAALVAIVGHAFATIPFTILSLPLVAKSVASAWRRRTRIIETTHSQRPAEVAP